MFLAYKAATPSYLILILTVVLSNTNRFVFSAPFNPRKVWNINFIIIITIYGSIGTWNPFQENTGCDFMQSYFMPWITLTLIMMQIKNNIQYNNFFKMCYLEVCAWLITYFGNFVFGFSSLRLRDFLYDVFRSYWKSHKLSDEKPKKKLPNYVMSQA